MYTNGGYVEYISGYIGINVDERKMRVVLVATIYYY